MLSPPAVWYDRAVAVQVDLGRRVGVAAAAVAVHLDRDAVRVVGVAARAAAVVVHGRAAHLVGARLGRTLAGLPTVGRRRHPFTRQRRTGPRHRHALQVSHGAGQVVGELGARPAQQRHVRCLDRRHVGERAVARGPGTTGTPSVGVVGAFAAGVSVATGARLDVRAGVWTQPVSAGEDEGCNADAAASGSEHGPDRKGHPCRRRDVSARGRYPAAHERPHDRDHHHRSDARARRLGRLPATLVRPDADRGAGIVLVHEIFGRDGYMRRRATDFAALGYTVLLPQIFWRLGEDVVDEATEDALGVAMGVAQQVDWDLAVEDVRAAIKALRDDPATGQRVALVGFCFGGGLAYAAQQGADWTNGADALVSFYGSALPSSSTASPSLSRACTTSGTPTRSSPATRSVTSRRS